MTNVLRHWTYRKIKEAYDESLCLNANPNIPFLALDAPMLFCCFLQNIGGVWCGGAARTLTKLFIMYGFDSFSYCMGWYDGCLSHVVTVVRITGPGSEKWIVQDPYLNLTYSDKDGLPIDFFKMLDMLGNSQGKQIYALADSRATRGYLVQVENSHNVWRTWHYRLDQEKPEPAFRLSNGLLLYEIQPNAVKMLRTSDPMREMLSRKGLPEDVIYLYRFPLSVHSDCGVDEIARRIVGILRTNQVESRPADYLYSRYFQAIP